MMVRMTGETTDTLLMSVGGQRDPGDARPQQLGYPARAGAMMIPPGLLMPTSLPEPEAGEHPWMIPPDQGEAAHLVTRIAREMGHSVKVVDVNLPAGDHSVVSQFFTNDDVLPMLVRSDGSRIEGLDVFDPARVRSFLSHK